MPHSVLVFKTNINSVDQINRLGKLMKSKKGIQKWNLDLEDNDKVLRIVTDRLQEHQVISFLQPHLIYAENLN